MDLATTPLKVHLHMVPCGATTLRVLSLRPQCGVRYSTNYFHDTWHILTDPGGAAVLARLLWALAFQRAPDTVIALGHDHLVPTPFEADRPAPCVLAPQSRSPLTGDKLRALARHLRRPGPSHGTVKLQTFGMAAALEAYHAQRWGRRELDALWPREHMRHLEGLVCYAAPDEVLKLQALAVHRLREYFFGGTAYTYLAEHWQTRHHPEGEVQLFSDFTARVSAAQQARRALLPRPKTGHATSAEREHLWSEVDRRRERARRDRPRSA